MDPDFFWHTLGGGAVLTAALTLARLAIDSVVRKGERRTEQIERRRRDDRDAEARLERILQDRLAEADRRLQRCDAELSAERARAATLEHDLVRVQHAYALLCVECASLQQAEQGTPNPRARRTNERT